MKVRTKMLAAESAIDLSACQASISRAASLIDAHYAAHPTEDAPDDATVNSILADASAQATTVQASVAALNTAVCTSGAATTTTG